MKATSSIEGNKAIIVLEGHFTFESHRDFKESLSGVMSKEDVSEIEINFAKVDYLDSAALGMLLLLNERASGRKIILTQCVGTVKAVLDIANFNRIFEIH